MRIHHIVYSLEIRGVQYDNKYLETRYRSKQEFFSRWTFICRRTKTFSEEPYTQRPDESKSYFILAFARLFTVSLQF